MTFEITPSALSPVLGIMSKLIGSKPLMPVLGNVKFYEHNGHYLATATSGDQETVFTTELPLENVSGFHPFLVSVGELSQMVRLAEGSLFPLTFKTGTHNGGKASDRQLCIDYGEGEYQLIYEDAAEYPTTNVGDPTGSISLPASAVQYMSQATSFVSSDTLRPVMGNVLLDVRKDGTMRVVSTDSKTLYLANVSDVQSGVDLQLLFTPRTIGLIAGMLPRDGRVTVQQTAKFQIITLHAPAADDGAEGRVLCRIATRNVEGRYPRYEAVIPKANPNSMQIECQKFLASVNRVAVCAHSSTHQIRFDVAPGDDYIRVSAEDIDFSRRANTTIEVADHSEHVSEAMAIGLRYDYLLRCIRAIGTKEVQFTFLRPDRPCLLCSTDGLVTALIMPSQLTQM